MTMKCQNAVYVIYITLMEFINSDTIRLRDIFLTMATGGRSFSNIRLLSG
jgi:hypothetical protein